MNGLGTWQRVYSVERGWHLEPAPLLNCWVGEAGLRIRPFDYRSWDEKQLPAKDVNGIDMDKD